jgi:hypothetical protein
MVNVQILREGGVSREDISNQTGLQISLSKQKTVQTPGQLKKHYSYSKTLVYCRIYIKLTF